MSIIEFGSRWYADKVFEDKEGQNSKRTISANYQVEKRDSFF
jgi:hypothetical protein